MSATPSNVASPSRPSRRAGWKTWAARLLVLGAAGVVCLLLMEILVRILLPNYSPRNQFELQLNAEGVVTGPPARSLKVGTPKGDWDITVAFNEHGFRDPKDFARSSPDDLFVFGDSFSLGWGVEAHERYSNVLETNLGRPVFNLAIPEDIRGYQRTLAFAEKHGAQVRHLIVGLCMENDLWDYTLSGSTHVQYQKQMARTVRHRAARWFKAHSALWICASYTLQRQPAFRAFFEKIGIARNIEELTHSNEPTPRILGSTRDELLKLTTNRNALVLIIPSRALWHGRHTGTEERIHDQMVQSLRESGLKTLDMKPLFDQTGEPLGHYFKNDPHWNARGHALAATALQQHLAQAPEWQFLRARSPAIKAP